MTELELKFIVPAAALASLQRDLLARGARPLRLRAHYFDTGDMALARHRAALRLRLEGRHWVQTLKAAGAGAVHRLEHEVRLPGRPGLRPPLAPALHAGSAAAAGLAAALRGAADPTLLELHATDVRRLRLSLHDAQGTHIEAALDTGQALAAGRRDAIQELELEHKGGPLAGLFELAIACVRHGGLWQSTLTKAERGLRLHLGRRGSGVTVFQPAVAAAEAGAPAVQRACLQAALTPVLAHAGALASAEPAADADASAVSKAFGADLARLGALLRLLDLQAPSPCPAWRRQLVRMARRWQAHRHDDKALCALARDTEGQVLWLQLQQLAHASDAAYTALSAAAWRRRRAALRAAGLLQA